MQIGDKVQVRRQWGYQDGVEVPDLYPQDASLVGKVGIVEEIDMSLPDPPHFGVRLEGEIQFLSRLQLDVLEYGK